MQIGVAEDKRSKPLAAFLLLYCTTFTVVYLYVVNPVFHEVSQSCYFALCFVDLWFPPTCTIIIDALQIMFAILGFAVIFLDIKLATQGKEKMGISPKPFFVILFL